MDLSKLYTQHKTLDVTHALLTRLYQAQTPPPLVIPQLAALHTGMGETDKPLRTQPLPNIGVPVPAPVDLEKLVGLLLGRLFDNLHDANQPNDDYLLAALATYGLTTIRPFEDGNGRTALDFAQYFIMWQRKSPTPLLITTAQSHREFARLFVDLAPPSEVQPEAGCVAVRNHVVALLDRANMPYLRSHSTFRQAATWFAGLTAGH